MERPSKSKAPKAPNAAKAAAKPRAKAVKSTPASIDYPKQNERVSPGHYAVRIGTSPEAATVELQFDKGPWQACRSSAGYWWFDWDAVPGAHVLVARAEGKNGLQRRCRVVAPEEPSKTA